MTGAIPHAAASTGASVVMAGQLAAMAARHRVTLVTFPPASSAQETALAEWRAAGVSVHTAAATIPASIVRAKRGIERAVRRLQTQGPRLEPTTGDARTQAVIDRLIETEPFDVVQAESIGVGSFRYPTSIPSLLTEHEVGRFGSNGASESWSTRQPVIWAPFNRVQVFTERDAATFRSVAPGLAARVRVNPFGIDLPPQPRIAEEADSLVFVGSFNHGPNVDAAEWLARDILPRVALQHSAVKLWLVGEDPPARVAQLANTNIVVTGRVPDVNPHLQRAAVVVAPVRTGGGMRQKVLHALALGKAVVTTPLGAEGLMGATADLPLAATDNAVQFGEHVARLLASPVERRNLGDRARAFVAQHHSWRAHADRLEHIYEELVHA